MDPRTSPQPESEMTGWAKQAALFTGSTAERVLLMGTTSALKLSVVLGAVQ